MLTLVLTIAMIAYMVGCGVYHSWYVRRLEKGQFANRDKWDSIVMGESHDYINNNSVSNSRVHNI